MSVIIMILLISMLIVVHEIGHFLAAKSFGIAVPKFGFGLPIGPTLFKKKFGETEILVHAFLLGGYVSFLDDEEHPEVPKDSPLRFQNKPIWQRAIVVSAGVIANAITAVLLVMLTAVAVQSLPARENQVYINRIIAPQNAPIYSIGLQKGDRVYKLNGIKVIDVSFLSRFVAGSYKFNGETEEKRVVKKLNELKQLNPKLSDTESIAKGTTIVLPSFDNEAPVLYSKDFLIGLDNKNSLMKTVFLSDEQKKLRNEIFQKKNFVTNEELTLKDIAYAVSDTVAPLNITVQRGEEFINLPPLYADESGKIGVESIAKAVRKPTTTLKSVVKESVIYLYDTTYLMLVGLTKLFTGHVPMKDLHGIVVITKIGSDVISNAGFFQGVILTAMISINLAIMNLLPIPALDGGHLLFLIIEKLQGKPLNEKVLEKISSVCFILLLTLMCLIIFNDIVALVTKKFG